MNARPARPFAVAALVLSVAMLAGCNDMRIFGATGLEGTYRLVSRELPDGTIVEPPVIQGLMTFTNEYRNFNITWTEGSDRISISSIAEYIMTDDRYVETNIFYLRNDQISGEGVTYDLSGQTGMSEVLRQSGQVEFDLPLHDEPNVVFTKEGFTATREGEFVDYWEEVD